MPQTCVDVGDEAPDADGKKVEFTAKSEAIIHPAHGTRKLHDRRAARVLNLPIADTQAPSDASHRE
jgi:hypothetical protein